MSIGNLRTEGGKGTNFPWQLAMLRAAQAAVTNGAQYGEQDFGAVTGSTVTLAHIPTHIYGVFKNGQRLTNGTDYSISGAIVTFVNPLVADLITVTYNY